MERLYYIVGSYALQVNKNTNINHCNDLDVIQATDDKFRTRHKGKRDVFVSKTLYDILDKYATKEMRKSHIATSNVVYTLKLSHLNHNQKNNNWGKHFLDCIELSKTCTVELDLFHELKEFWNSYYKDKDHINLNKQPENFFNQEYNQQHDELHKHFSIGISPAYTYFLRDNHQVLPSKAKFNELPKHIKQNSVIEEAMVIAYERKLPLAIGFKKLITDLSKGWWNDYIILNLSELYELVQANKQIFKHKSKLVNQQFNQKGKLVCM